jgi:hypothetical protein
MNIMTIVVKGVPVEVWKRLKIHAIEQDRTLQDEIVIAIQAYLDRAA